MSNGAQQMPLRGPGGQRRMGYPGGKRPKPDKKTMKRMFSYLLFYKFRLLIVLFCIILSAVASIASSLFIKTLIDDYINPLLLMAEPVFAELLHTLLLMGALYLAGVIATMSYNLIMVRVAQGILKKIRDQMFEHMQSLPINYFDTHSHGDIMSCYTNDTDTLRQMISQSIPQIIMAAVKVTGVFLSMIVINLWLTLFVVVSLAFMITTTRKIAGKSGTFFMKQQQSLGKINGFIEEMIHGQKVVKVFCHEEKAKEQFDTLNEELCSNATRANSFANILMPVLGNLGNLQYALLAIFGGILAINGVAGLTLGTIATFLQLSKSFIQPINQVTQQLNMIVMALAGAKRIFALLDEKPEEDNGYVTLVNAELVNGVIKESSKATGHWAWKHPHKDGTTTYTLLRGEVTLDDVVFGYTDEKIVLHHINLTAKEGQKIAFVGATGAGKTTITNLINRFYDIADGKIRYDGININKIKKADLRRSLGVVLQDVNLFTGTVMENIRYGKLDATEEEVYEAARLANADDFINRLPEGYQTVLSGDGQSLSQGQRQLISIARAAVYDPPVMILDEATSSIDTRTEVLVQKGMDSLMDQRTVFVIAHRLSTIQDSDCIIVLDHGKIIEQGNHEQLIAKKGKYYQLYTGAFELDP